MTRKQPFTFEEFKSIFSQVPRLCVDLLINNQNGTLLTLRQKNGFVNKWHFPGGTVFYREKFEDAIQRVAQEELGIKVKIKKNVGYIIYLSEVEERGFGYSVSMVFLCRPVGKNFRLDDQVEKIKFFKTIPKNIIIEQKDFLKKFKKEKVIDTITYHPVY